MVRVCKILMCNSKTEYFFSFNYYASVIPKGSNRQKVVWIKMQIPVVTFHSAGNNLFPFFTVAHFCR
jgi:hypothetical protein